MTFTITDDNVIITLSKDLEEDSEYPYVISIGNEDDQNMMALTDDQIDLLFKALSTLMNF